MNKKILIGGIALVLLAGGGGGFFYLQKPKGGDAKAAERHVEAVPVRIPFLAVPVVEGGKLLYYTVVSVTLNTPSNDDAEAVKQDLPRVVDMILDAFHNSPDGSPIQNQLGEEAALSARLKVAMKAAPMNSHIQNVVVSTDHPAPR